MFSKIKAFLTNMNTEVIRYIIVGGCTTLVNLIVFTVMCKFLNIDVTLSNFVSVVTSIIFAYITNKIFVFQSKCETIQQLISEASKFIGARLLTMVIEVGGVFLLVNIIGQDELIGKLETQVIVLISNYVISKFLVFKN
ncbi:GtrA family protein [Candidatus Stoquefichus sp. SB1]|jgi:putative flippase GtrA|uniref:GtrA family protein n=1 Tax=Candidatus Stoquefichus sp. SB1 TaxID=1658109 RepID=UPI00067EBE6D|nr:GtrA family protein [Candidatus Stoquefichus sp. SB1]